MKLTLIENSTCYQWAELCNSKVASVIFIGENLSDFIEKPFVNYNEKDNLRGEPRLGSHSFTFHKGLFIPCVNKNTHAAFAHLTN